MSAKVHRSGPFKQQNKTHKIGKHLSKGTLSSLRKGTISYLYLVVLKCARGKPRGTYYHIVIDRKG